MENKYKNSSKKKTAFGDKNNNKQTRSRVLSLAQLLSRIRKQRGFSGFVQVNSNAQSNNMQNSQSRNLQLGTTSKTSFGNSSYETNPSVSSTLRVANQRGSEGKGKFYGDQGLNPFGLQTQRDKMFLSNSSSGVSKMRIETQKEEQKRQRPIKPIIPPKSLVIILREKPEKILYNRRIIDYKHCGLLQRYIGLGGKILPRRQTRLTAKQQRYIAKTIKSARIMGLLPFVSKEKGFFR